MAARRVLVVDDDEGFQHCMLRSLGDYELVAAYNERQMLAALDHEVVDVVLLDLELPGRNGFDLLPTLGARQIPTIVISAHAGASNVVRAVHGGAFDFLEKGLESYRRLPGRIEAALAHRRWAGQGKDPPCLAEMEELLHQLAGFGLGAPSVPRAAACDSALWRVTEHLVDRDRSRDRGRSSPYRALCDHFRRLLVRVALYRSRGNARQAALLLGVSYRSFLRWTEFYRRDGDS